MSSTANGADVGTCCSVCRPKKSDSRPSRSVRLAVDSFIHYNSMMGRMPYERWTESAFERIRG